jgi:hypothetical protein
VLLLVAALPYRRRNFVPLGSGEQLTLTLWGFKDPQRRHGLFDVAETAADHHVCGLTPRTLRADRVNP